MIFPRQISLYHVPSTLEIEAAIIELSDLMMEVEMGERWWNDTAIDSQLAAGEIDRHWNWTDLAIERDGRVIGSRSLAVVTTDNSVQGALMLSTEPVPCERKQHRGKGALFVELLFAAPRTRHWIRRDRSEQFRGIGLHLMRAAAELSLEYGLEGRLKLESSPGFVDWYRKRGLLEVSQRRILHEGVRYTPMELEANRLSTLLPDFDKGK